MKNNVFIKEWCLLQNQFDSYEKHSLYIKLLSIVVLLTAVICGVTGLPIMLILLVLWLQDAIWKTFQSRIEPRLLQVEKAISDADNIDSMGSATNTMTGSACQFNSDYHQLRLTGVALMVEYLCQAIRPTVAFPHIVLVLILLIGNVF
jgi:hypothetical protein